VVIVKLVGESDSQTKISTITVLFGAELLPFDEIRSSSLTVTKIQLQVSDGVGSKSSPQTTSGFFEVQLIQSISVKY
jgi:hypothetical protein